MICLHWRIMQTLQWQMVFNSFHSSWLFEFSFAVLHTFQTFTFLLTKSEATLPLSFPTKSTWLSLVRSSQTSANVQLETCVSKLVLRPSTVTFPSFSVTQLSFPSSSPPAVHTHTPDYLLPSSSLSYALLFCIPYSILPSLPPLKIQWWMVSRFLYNLMQQWVVLREEEQDSERVCYTVNIFSVLFHSRERGATGERGRQGKKVCDRKGETPPLYGIFRLIFSSNTWAWW